LIPLLLRARAEGDRRYVARLQSANEYVTHPSDVALLSRQGSMQIYAGSNGLLQIDVGPDLNVDGDVVVVDPSKGIAERLIRARSPHNTLLVTERCDQLCVMCSQPPKKTHFDRFSEFTEACKLAPVADTIGISGGEPTLYKHELFALLEEVLNARPDLSFHVLTNGQHFDANDIETLSQPAFTNVTWGIPLYSSKAVEHDRIVGKSGAFERLSESLLHLLMAGSQVELRTVVLTTNISSLAATARYIGINLPFILQWSIMQLENIGFARRRFDALFVPFRREFALISEAIDIVELCGLEVALFNFPRCAIPTAYRDLAAASISDWKRKYVQECDSCREKHLCSGFFEWHPDNRTGAVPL
jgi:His-Xaa-Ser system radical SAM maturase HxsC